MREPPARSGNRMIDATILRIRGQHAPTGPGELSAPATRTRDALERPEPSVTAPSARAARGVVWLFFRSSPTRPVQPQRVQSNRKLTQDA
jgi:hypothetical protein